MLLTPEEVRVLGCLVEKELATPQHYPLTENAVIAACNQATKRDPVVAYDQSTVRGALINLRQQGLAAEARRPGERAAKHRHLLRDALDLADPELAVLCLLAVRGPQTVGELRARSDRLHPFADAGQVEQALTTLSSHPGGALAERQDRRPGQKEARWSHRLGEQDAGPSAPPAEPTAPPLDTLAATVRELEAEVARLRDELDALRDERSEI